MANTDTWLNMFYSAKEMQVPKTLLIENGDIIKILPGDEPQIVDKAPSGKIYLDGNINVETDSQSIKERKNLSMNGYLEITLIVSNNGNIKNQLFRIKVYQNKMMMILLYLMWKTKSLIFVEHFLWK